MKKALQISLAHTLFTIEEDAYTRLAAYLESIRSLFANVEGKEEIISDIEGRIAERFLESKKSIVAIEEVNQIIEAMGLAEEYKEDIAGSPPPPAPPGPKKFYRDPQGALLGGVCTGLATYFNIEVIWVRLLFVIGTILNGLGLLVYLVIWLIAPEAKTSSQRLEMEGLPVTIETLKETASEAMKSTGTTVRTAGHASAETIRYLVHSTLGAVLLAARWVMGIGLTVLGVLVALAVSFALPFIASTGQGTDYFPMALTDLLPVPLLWAIFLTVYLVCIIPCIVALLLGLSLLWKKWLVNNKFLAIASGLWIVALMVLAALSAYVVPTIHHSVETSPLFERIDRVIPLSAEVVTTLEVEDGVHIMLLQGDTPSLNARGVADDLDRLSIETKNGTLSFHLEEDLNRCLFCSEQPLEITLTLPSLQAVRVDQGSGVIFFSETWNTETPLTLSAKNASVIDWTGNAPEIIASADNGSTIVLREGAVEKLTVSALNRSNASIATKGDIATLTTEYGASMDLLDAHYNTVIAIARQGSSLSLGAVMDLTATAEQSSDIHYTTASTLNETTTMGGTIESYDTIEYTIPSGG